MTRRANPLCSWTGVNAESGDAIVCGLPATAFVIEADGRLVYTCPEHVASAKARAHSGKIVTGGFRTPILGHPPVPPPEVEVVD